jgi:transposase, IS5 family
LGRKNYTCLHYLTLPESETGHAFASLASGRKGKVTRRERFLGEMDAVIRWSRLVRLIEPHYPKAGQGRQPLGLEKMLRIYFLQQWFNLPDPQAEDAIYDSESTRRFARVELGDEVVPDESRILRLRHLLEQHGLTEAIFNSITGLLEERRLLLRSGTIVDATIILFLDYLQHRWRPPSTRLTPGFAWPTRKGTPPF